MNWFKALTLAPVLAVGQVVPGNPSAFQPVSPDTLSDTAIISVQLPPYGGGAPIRMRRLTMENLSAFVKADSGGTINPDTVHAVKGVFDTLTAVDAFYLDYTGVGIAIKTAQNARITLQQCAVGDLVSFSGGGSTGWEGVSSGPALFAMGGFSTPAGGLQTTADGVTFSRPASPTNNALSAGTYGLSKFIMVGAMDADSTDGIITSSDGVTWTDVKGISGTATYAAVGCNTTRCMIGGNSSALISTDNLTSFTARTYGGSSVAIRGLAYSTDSSRWVGCASDGSIRFSDDNGVNWSATGVTSVVSSCRRLIWSSTLGLFITVGSGGQISTSPDGKTWTLRTSGTNLTLYGLGQGGGKLVASGDSLVVVTSSDGITWTKDKAGVSALDLYGVGYVSPNFFVVGENGRVYTSTTADSGSWTRAGESSPTCLTPAYLTNDSLAANVNRTIGGRWLFTDSIRTPVARVDTLFAMRGRFSDTVSSAMGVRSANYNAGGLAATFGGSIVPGISASAAGAIFRGNTNGMNLRGITGSVNDVAIRNAADSIIISNPTGSRTVLVGVNATGGTGSYIGFGLSNGTPINQNAGNIVEIENNTALQVTLVGSSSQLTGYARAGTKASPTATVGDANLLSLAGRGYNGSAYTTGSSGFFSIRADGLWSGSNNGTYHTWFGTPNGSTTMAEWMRLFASNLGIGTTVSGTGALKTLVLSNSSTGPSSSTDLAHLYARDVSAGNAALAIYAEAAEVAGTGSGTDQLIPVYYNGAVRYILTKSAP